jgi:hypothetical protein
MLAASPKTLAAMVVFFMSRFRIYSPAIGVFVEEDLRREVYQFDP